MNCAITVAKNIAGFAGFLLSMAAISAVLFAAGAGTAWLFGWTGTPGPALAFFAVYGVIVAGTWLGIEECRRQ